MSDLIRARQPIITRLFPHQANRRFMVPHHGPVVAGPGQIPLGLLGQDAHFGRVCDAAPAPAWQCNNYCTFTPGNPGSLLMVATAVPGTALAVWAGGSPALDPGVAYTMAWNAIAGAEAEAQVYKAGVSTVQTDWNDSTTGLFYMLLAAGVATGTADVSIQLSNVVGNEMEFDFVTLYAGDWSSQLDAQGATGVPPL